MEEEEEEEEEEGGGADLVVFRVDLDVDRFAVGVSHLLSPTCDRGVEKRGREGCRSEFGTRGAAAGGIFLNMLCTDTCTVIGKSMYLCTYVHM